MIPILDIDISESGHCRVTCPTCQAENKPESGRCVECGRQYEVKQVSELIEACERALQVIENAYGPIGPLDMTTEVGKDVEFIAAALRKAMGEQ
jgi:peptide subunit release factor 1 (eRF1)